MLTSPTKRISKKGVSLSFPSEKLPGDSFEKLKLKHVLNILQKWLYIYHWGDLSPCVILAVRALAWNVSQSKMRGVCFHLREPCAGEGQGQLALRSSAAGIFLDGAWGQERKASFTSGFPSACPDLNFLLNVACYESPSFCGFPTICTKSVTGECHFLRTKEGPCTLQTPGRTVLTGQLDYPHCTHEQAPAPGS